MPMTASSEPSLPAQRQGAEAEAFRQAPLAREARQLDEARAAAGRTGVQTVPLYAVKA